MKKDKTKFNLNKLKKIKLKNFKSISKNKNFFKNKLSIISSKIDNLVELNNKDNNGNTIYENRGNSNRNNNNNNNYNNNYNFDRYNSNNTKIEFKNLKKEIEDKKFKEFNKIDKNNSIKNIKNIRNIKSTKNTKNRNNTEINNLLENERDIESIVNVKSIRKAVNNDNNTKNKITDKKHVNNKNMGNKDINNKYVNDKDINNRTINNLNNRKLYDNGDNENNEDLDELKEMFNFNLNPIKKIKNSLNDDDSKTVMGGAIFGLIIIVLLFSSYYFFFYQPYQEDLVNAKTNKLNELNSLFKGPLALDGEVLSISSEIELAKSPEEVNSVDILRPATASWRKYQTKQINNTKDDFNRVMVSYDSAGSENNFDDNDKNNNNKNIIMNVDQAKQFVNNNDGKVLANVVINTPDTVAVPILITKLQAGAGLITIGSVVDIYTLSDETSETQSDSSSSSSEENLSNSNEGNSQNTDNSTEENNEENSTENENNSDNKDNNEDNSKNNDNYDSSSSQNNGNANVGLDGFNPVIGQNSKSMANSPDISGSTILAIMRSKDSGVIDSNYIKSKNSINGNISNQVENSNSFSTDVEELIRASISGGYDEQYISSLLDDYGLKLANYERKSSLGEIDVQYLLLIEVPRDDVSHVINNMDSLILTIPTGEAPDWMVDELKQTYLNNS